MISIDDALRSKGIELRSKRYGVWLRAKCPFSGCADKKRKLNLSVRLDSEFIGYKCHRCGEHGRIQLSAKPESHGVHKRSRAAQGRVSDWRPHYNGPARQ